MTFDELMKTDEDRINEFLSKADDWYMNGLFKNAKGENLPFIEISARTDYDSYFIADCFTRVANKNGTYYWDNKSLLLYVPNQANKDTAFLVGVINRPSILKTVAVESEWWVKFDGEVYTVARGNK